MYLKNPGLLLLLAAFTVLTAAVEWTDVMYSVMLNVTTKRVCTVDNPSYCIYTAVLNTTIDIRNTYVAAVYYDPTYMRWFAAGVVHPSTIILWDSTVNTTVYTPAGYVLAPESVTVNGKVPDRVTLCGRNFTAVRVSAGAQRISGSLFYICDVSFCYEPVRFLDPVDCTMFTLIEHESMLRNITNSWAYVYILHMPTARRVDVDYFREVFNGTHHAYFTKVRGAVPVGAGFYIVNKTRVPAIVVMPDTYNVYYGPKAADSLHDEDLDFYRPAACTAYTIGPHPGDGVLAVGMPPYIWPPPSGPVDLAYISDYSAGYFRLNMLPSDRPIFIFASRYSLGEVAFLHGSSVYATRTIACPPYAGTTSPDGVYTVFLRAESAKEIEICSNRTSVAYLALTVNYYGFELFTFIDRVEPGKCRRLRWDGSFRAADTKLYIYSSAQDVCLKSHVAVKQGGADYTADWRYYLMPDGSLIPASPIDPDEFYATTWREIIQTMAQQHNETLHILKQWYEQQLNILKSLIDYLKHLISQLDYRLAALESSLSEWLRKILEILRRTSAPGGSETATGPLAPVGTLGSAVPAVPVFVPSIRLQLPPYAVGLLLLAVFVAAYATFREVSLASLVTGAAVAVIGIFVNAPIYSAAGIFLMAFGLWNKVRRQSA